MKNLKNVFLANAASSNQNFTLIREAHVEIARLSEDYNRAGIQLNRESLLKVGRNAPATRYVVDEDSIKINIPAIVSRNHDEALEFYWLRILPYRYFMRKGNDLESHFAVLRSIEEGTHPECDFAPQWIQFDPDAPNALGWFAFLHFYSLAQIDLGWEPDSANADDLKVLLTDTTREIASVDFKKVNGFMITLKSNQLLHSSLLISEDDIYKD